MHTLVAKNSQLEAPRTTVGEDLGVSVWQAHTQKTDVSDILKGSFHDTYKILHTNQYYWNCISFLFTHSGGTIQQNLFNYQQNQPKTVAKKEYIHMHKWHIPSHAQFTLYIYTQYFPNLANSDVVDTIPLMNTCADNVNIHTSVQRTFHLYHQLNSLLHQHCCSLLLHHLNPCSYL